MGSCYRYPNAEKCVNCGWNMCAASGVSRFFDYRVGQLPEPQKELLTSWLPPLDDLDTHAVCRDCYNLLCKLADEPRPVERQRAHKEVCAACGESVHNKRTNALNYDRPEHEVFRRFVQEHQGESWRLPSRICHKCQKKCVRDRDIARYQQMQSSRVYMVVPVDNLSLLPETEEEIQPEPKPKRAKVEKKPKPVKKTIVKHAAATTAKKEKQEPRQVNFVTLDGYWNSFGGTTALCVACGQFSTHRVNLKTRQHVMLHKKLYVSNYAKVCGRHRKPANWPDYDDIFEKDKFSNEFTTDEVVDMFFLLKGEKAVNFRNVEKLHYYRMDQWFGVTVKEYQKILQRNPVLSQHRNGKFALSVYLAKRHKRTCVKVLASASQQSEDFVTACLKLATECLQTDNRNEQQDDENMDENTVQ